MSETLDPADRTTAAGPDPRRWLALGVIATAQLMIVLDASIVNIALPSAQADLGISDADRQWVVTAYTLAFGGLLLLGGRIADYVGRKRIFVIGLVGFALASALGGFVGTEVLRDVVDLFGLDPSAAGAGMLYSARALQGAFAALMAPAALSLISVTFTEAKERAIAFSVFGALSGGGAAIGLIVGGVLTEYADWRWCLGVNVPIALATAFAAVPLVHESKAQGNTKYDIPGVVMATLGLVSLVYGFTEAARAKNPGRGFEVQGWTDSSTVTFLGIGLALLVAFVIWELRASQPLLPLRVVLDRNRGGSNILFLFLGAGMFPMFLFVTYYMQLTLGYSPLKSGFAFLPFSVGMIITAGVVSQLLPKLGPRPILLTGILVGTAGMLWLTQISAEGSSYWTHVFPSMIIMSTGLAGVFIPASTTALLRIEEHDTGVGSAVLNTAQQVGGSLGIALLNTLFASSLTGYLTDHPSAVTQAGPADAAFVHGYQTTFLWSAILFLGCLAAIVFLINARKEDVPAEPGAVVA